MPDAPLKPVRIPPEHRAAAAARLIAGDGAPDLASGRRFLRAAPEHGIDVSMFWGRPHPAGGAIEPYDPVVLAVPAPGRTAMLFISQPRLLAGVPTTGDPVLKLAQILEQVALDLGSPDLEGRVAVAQALPEMDHQRARRALARAGFTHVGDLAYLNCDRPAEGWRAPEGPPPGGVRVRTAEEIARETSAAELDARLIAALNASYEGTLDCPELCGLRDPADILDSHRATGTHDPALWRLAERDDGASAVCLFSRSNDGADGELVYLGLAPALRGCGLGAWLLDRGLADIGARGARRALCAVDLRNTPALRLYERRGFCETSRRGAFVRRVVTR